MWLTYSVVCWQEAELFDPVSILLIGETHGAHGLIGEGFPHKCSPQKAMKVIISISDLIEQRQHMFRIWTLAVAPLPAKDSLYPFTKWAHSTSLYIAACLLTG